MSTLEYFICIWFDPNLDDGDICRKTQTKIRRIIHQLRLINDENECLTMINEITMEKIILIVSGQSGSILIPKIHHLTQLAAFYVFCRDQQTNERWSNSFNKCHGVFVKTKDLILQLKTDHQIRATIDDNVAMSVINKDERESTQCDPILLWFLVYFEILLRMKYKLADQKEFLDFCREFYRDNLDERKNIDEFDKTYRAEEAIRWYTRETCFYRIINQALRIANFDVLVKAGFFIADIAKQIKNEHEKFIRTTTTRRDPFVIYRGQIIDKEQLKRIQDNEEEYLSIKSFISCSRKRQKAIQFARHMPLIDNTERVLLIIQIDPQLKTKPFADVAQFSSFRQEREVLIMAGALFRIDGVVKDVEADLWLIKLTLVDEDQYELNETLAHLRNKIHQETNLASLGKILCQMGYYDLAEKIYRKMLFEAQLDVSMANTGLSKVELGKNHFQQALNYELEAMRIRTPLISSSHPDIAISYSRIGDLYNRLGQTDEALENLSRALKLQEENYESQMSELAKTYQRIASIYDRMNQYDLALDYYQKVLDIRQMKLPTNSPSLAATYHHIGRFYHNHSQSTMAANFYRKALRIYEKILPENHKKIVELRQDIDKRFSKT